MKARPDPAAPTYVDLGLVESDQVQEAWVCERKCGPETFLLLDGLHAEWWPSLTIERARQRARYCLGLAS